MKDDRLFLTHILERIQLIEEFTQPGQTVFLTSRLIQEGVIRNFEVIGEATRNLSDELKQQYPDVPWRQMADFRNFLIHVYWGVKPERVWAIVEINLPTLKVQIQKMLDDYEKATPDE